jgi:hypothetical protein
VNEMYNMEYTLIAPKPPFFYACGNQTNKTQRLQYCTFASCHTSLFHFHFYLASVFVRKQDKSENETQRLSSSPNAIPTSNRPVDRKSQICHFKLNPYPQTVLSKQDSLLQCILIHRGNKTTYTKWHQKRKGTKMNRSMDLNKTFIQTK